jgi:c-type cytochrome biogenesis protein CcmF
MTSTIGHILMILSASFSFLQWSCSIYRHRLLRIYSILTYTSCSLMFLWLVKSYVVSDFSIINVALNSHTEKNLFYKISAVWSNHEGSMLLWVFLISFTGCLASFRVKYYGDYFYSVFLKYIGCIVFFLVVFVGTTSDPFWSVYPIPKEGAGLNPLLQDTFLSIHPPILYLGYSLMAILFSLSIAAIKVFNKYKVFYFKELYPWSLVTWSFSTLSLILGSYWAYYQLGWGGWWFWDPVEMISLLPWISTAVSVHILRNVKLGERDIILSFIFPSMAFCLSIISTFFVRSGLLTSVHSFADDGGRGMFLIIFLFILLTVLFSNLYYLTNNSFQLSIRKGSSTRAKVLLSLVYTSVILILIIFVSIIYPLLIEKFNDKKILLGDAYFSKTFIPVIYVSLLLSTIAMILPIYNNLFSKKKFYISSISLLTSCLLSSVLYMEYDKIVVDNIFLVFWFIVFLLSISTYRLYQYIHIHGKKLLYRSSFFVFIGHIGIYISCLGMCIDKGLGEEKNIVLSVGDNFFLNNFKITMEPLERGIESNYFYERSPFSVHSSDGSVVSFSAEKRFFKTHQILTTKIGRWRNVFSEVYMVPGSIVGESKRSFRVYYRPYVYFIWLGGILVVISLIMSSIVNFRSLKL